MKRFCSWAVVLLMTLPILNCSKEKSGETPQASSPTVTITFSPSSGLIGSLVTFTGTDFTTADTVTVGGTPAVIVNQSSTDLTALVMPGTVDGTAEISFSGTALQATGTFTVNTGSPIANQQGTKLLGTGGVGAQQGQGTGVGVSADGNTALVGAYRDDTFIGAAWVFTRSAGVWTQEGAKLVGTGAVGAARQGWSAALSADGNTAIIGGYNDNAQAGAAWVFTRTGGVWSQQGAKLVGTGAIGTARQGWSVALSADGNTAIIGATGDNGFIGAAWIFTRSGGIWSQQGNKLVGTGGVGTPQQGASVSLSADGNTAVVGGSTDNSAGAVWIFTRSGGVWTQDGPKLTGTGMVGNGSLGAAVDVSADGNTIITSGRNDNSGEGAVWFFVRSGGVWSQQGGKLVPTGPATSRGYSVSISADGNTAFAGSPFGTGGIWRFTRSAGVWSQQGARMLGTGYVGPSGGIGSSLALSTDGSTLAVGCEFDNTSMGAAWVFVP